MADESARALVQSLGGMSPRRLVQSLGQEPADEEDASLGADIASEYQRGVTGLRETREAEHRGERKGALGFVREFAEIAGGLTQMAMSPATGLIRHYGARPLAGRFPEQSPADTGQSVKGLVTGEGPAHEFLHLLSRSPSEVARASAQRPFSRAGTREEQLERATTALSLPLPGVGVGSAKQIGQAARWAVTPKVVSPVKEFTTNVGDELHRIRNAGTADRAEITKEVEAMPSETRQPDIQRALYNFIEESDPARLPAEDRAVLADPVKGPQVLAAATQVGRMRQELSDIYDRLRNLGMPANQLVDPQYIHRRAVGHTPILDPTVGAASELPYGMQRTLPKTTSALQERKFMGGFDASGNRVVLSRDPDTGAMAVHTPGSASPTPVAPHPTNPDQFLYNGRTWAIGQTTSHAVEEATAGESKPTTYYKNALANTADALVRMRAVERHTQFLENLTTRPEWSLYATRGANAARRMHWEETSIPQLRGWYLHPKLRAAFDDFYRPGMGANEALNALRKANQFAVSTLFWNPTPHVENVLGHWAVGRGFDWITPQGWRSVAVDGAKAIKEVTTQGPEYRRMLREGSGMIFGGVMNADFYENIARLAGLDIARQPARWDPIARTLGMGPSDLVRALYEGSKRTLWWANDVMMMQRVLELERKGLSTRAAIHEAEKHIPNYRIPTEVMGSREFSQILQEPAVTVFSRYHYGLFKSYANMLNDLFRGDLKEKRDAVGNMLALGLLTWVIYPQLDRAVKAVTGEESAEKLRRGPATMPNLVQHIYQGDESLSRLMGDALTLSLPVHVGAAAFGGGRDPFTGQPIMMPGATGPEQATQAADYLLGQVVQPYQLLGRRTEGEGGRSPQRAMVDQMLGLKNTSPATLRGKAKAEKFQRRAAQKRRVHPGGPIERLFQGGYGGGDE